MYKNKFNRKNIDELFLSMMGNILWKLIGIQITVKYGE
jgi:hypothetical protein